MTRRPGLDTAIAAMSEGERELAARAREALAARYREGVHEVAAAMRGDDGEIYVGLHVEASQGRASVCAEGAALSAAALAGARIVQIVGVLRRPQGSWHVIEPCGVCGELLADHCPDATVWITAGSEPSRARVSDLLPARVIRAGRAAAGAVHASAATAKEDS